VLRSRSMRLKLGFATLCSSALLLLGFAARAQEGRDPAAAEELFRQGRAASEKHDFLSACAKFRESNRLDPAVGTLFNIADCEERLGHLATSWTLFQEVVQRLPTDDDRRAIAQRRAQTLEARLPKLSVHLSPSARTDIVVRRDGVALGSASLDTWLPVDPGEHVVVVEAPGTSKASFTARVSEGEHAALEVKLGAPLPSSGPPSNSASSAAPTSHVAAYVVGGVGVLGLATGVVAGLLVLQRKSTVDKNCVEHVCNQVGHDAAESGKTLGLVTTVGLVTGAAGLGAATYLFLSAPTPTDKTRSGSYMLGIRAKW